MRALLLSLFVFFGCFTFPGPGQAYEKDSLQYAIATLAKSLIKGDMKKIQELTLTYKEMKKLNPKYRFSEKKFNKKTKRILKLMQREVKGLKKHVCPNVFYHKAIFKDVWIITDKKFAKPMVRAMARPVFRCKKRIHPSVGSYIFIMYNGKWKAYLH